MTSTKVGHKASETTGEFLGNKISDTVVQSNDDKIVKTKPIVEITIPQEKIEETLNELRQIL